MTLTAPKSRQGKFVLVLAFLATVVAVLGLLLWATIAQAQLPANTTSELDQTPDGPATIAPAAAVSYDAQAITTTTVTAGDTLVIEIEIPATLTTPVVACVPAATSSNTTTDATCVWDAATAGTYTATLSGTAGGDLPVPASEVCSVLIAAPDCDIDVFQVETATVIGTITTSGDALVVVTAAGMTGSPKTLLVAVLNTDTASVVAGKMVTALQADSDVTALFGVTGAGADIILTRLIVASNDATLNIRTDDSTSVGLTDAPTSVDTTAGGGDDAEAVVDGDADTGLLTMSAVTVPDATNFPGEPHIFIFDLAAGVTCQSDSSDTNDTVDCVAGDVVIGGTDTCAITSGPTVTTGALATPSFVSVTIDGGTGVDLGTCTVTLDTYFVGPDDEDTADDFDIAVVVATKTFDVAEAAGEIRHRDDPDLATEDAAGTNDSDPLEDWCVRASPAGYDCGILTPQDDSDDATGSFHQACIINGSLTHTTDSGFITWSIVAVAGSPLPNPESITELSGSPDLDEPCVSWSTGFTGVQNITAVYDNLVGPAITFYWDGYCVEFASCIAVEDADTFGVTEPVADIVVPLPLVKEWNTIDVTKIVSVTGVVGDTLTANTLGLGVDAAAWAARDCSTDPVDAGLCTAANLDGLTLDQDATIFVATPQLFIGAPAQSFIDYTLGAHSNGGGVYDGPVDGAEQTYTISGDCGSVRLENPQTGDVIILSNSAVGDGVHDGADDYVSPAAVVNPYATAQILSSDKGVGFTFVPNDDGAIVTVQANADCGPEATICIGITTEEDNLFTSPPIDDAADEIICVTYTIDPPVAKTPSLAWAGQRVVLSHDWSAVIDCTQTTGSFYVLYSLQAGPGSFTAALAGNILDVSQTGQDVIVEVAFDGTLCDSHVIFENQDQAQNDIIAYIVDGPDLSTATPISQQVPFVIYYLKFEDATLTLVPGSRANHNSGDFSPDGPFDSSGDVTAMTGVNVSADVLARLRVRGWVTTSNCPVRDSGVGANGEFLPANRCIFPDDWRFKAGGGVGDSLNNPATVAGFAEESRPNFDLGDWNDSGVINAWDAPMPPALARFALAGAGFIRGADKDAIYDATASNNLNYATNIPASAFIAPINADLSGYQWNSFGGPGAKTGPYNFWNDLADNGAEVLSCAGPSTDAHVFLSGGTDPCGDGSGVATGGYHMTKVYTDNHGEAMTWINGDASLTFDDCVSSASAAGNMIVLLSGYYCENGDSVGLSTLSASVDYPDKRKHFAIESNDVTIDWIWGGIKEVTIEPGENAQFNYVVFHVTDRDGYCGTSPSLHPVLGERVVFTIDSSAGTIFADSNGNPAALLGTWTSKTADVTTFLASDTDTGVFNDPLGDDGISVLPLIATDPDECQAWIHITESLLGPVNVIVTAYDPEGTVTFDTIVNPVATPTPPVTPTPTPANQENLWADIDCSSGVGVVDSLKMLRADAGLSVSQDANCPLPSTDLDVIWDSLTTNDKWGDADCSGELTPVDSLKVLRFDAGLFYIQEEPCPDIGQEVLIPQQ